MTTLPGDILALQAGVRRQGYERLAMKTMRLFLMLLLAITFTACTGVSTPVSPDLEAAATPSESASTEVGSGEVVNVTVVYTNDEHGWMAGEDAGQGAAELAGLWQTYRENGHLLVLSGGDNWTGPAISSWFDGEGMVEAMNAMGYAASAVGNHEFDFGLGTLAVRSGQADFPYLAANLRYQSDGSFPADLGVEPYTIIDVAGVQIGLIGLSNTGTPTLTNPDVVGDLEFGDYAAALREYVPQVREQGADVVMVPAHICRGELNRLAAEVQDLEITLFGGGHCHEQFSTISADAVLLGGGSNFRSYAYATLQVDIQSGEVLVLDHDVVNNAGGEPDAQVAEIVARWQAAADAEVEVVIGYLADEVPQRSDQMAALITEAWLWAYPADVAVTNWGGMRADLPAGELTLAELISVMPFNNILVDVSLTGEELAKVLAYGSYLPAIGGLHQEWGQWVLNSSAQPLDPQASYRVLFNDFMYAGGDGYEMLARYDPDAYDTAIDWRQPVIDWIVAQESSIDQPLDEAIDALLP